MLKKVAMRKGIWLAAGALLLAGCAGVYRPTVGPVGANFSYSGNYNPNTGRITPGNPYSPSYNYPYISPYRYRRHGRYNYHRYRRYGRYNYHRYRRYGR